MSLKVIFAGTAEFAAPSLYTLINSSHHIVAVYTQPDRPAGRGQHMHASVIKEIGLSHHLPILQPVTLNTKVAREELQAFQADIMIVVAYGLLIPAKILRLPRYGCYNVHPSLLPRWRGAAPIQRAILNGDSVTGISIMQMDNGWDTGPILQQEVYSIEPDITSGELHEQLASSGAALLLKTLNVLEQQHSLQAHPQNTQGITHANKIEKKEGELHWSSTAFELHNQIRAFNPWPIAFTYYREEVLRIWKSQFLTEVTTQKPGMIIHADKNGIDVATGEGILRLLVLQLPGGKSMSVSDFLNSQHAYIEPGKTILGI